MSTGTFYGPNSFASGTEREGEGCRFFVYVLIVTLQHYMAVSMFRMAGAVMQNMISAYTAGAFLMLICFLLGGFLIAKRVLPGIGF